MLVSLAGTVPDDISWRRVAVPYNIGSLLGMLKSHSEVIRSLTASVVSLIDLETCLLPH
jgi:hypothetical protein